MAARRRFPACILLTLTMTGCKPATLGLPRVHASSTSPDGRFIAVVRNHPTLDPPDQSLWLEPAGGPARMVQRLSADQDWCDTIVWAPDSSLVGFLIQDARLVVARPATGQVVVDTWVVDRLGAYPPAQKAIDLAFLPDLTGVAFRACPRAGGECGALGILALPICTPPAPPARTGERPT